MKASVERTPRGNTNPHGTGRDAIIAYYQEAIDTGALQPGDIMPTYDDIASKFMVSRATASKAIARLQDTAYLRPSTKADGYVRVNLGGAQRKYALLADLLNDLEADGEDLHPVRAHGDGQARIAGNSATIRWNPENTQWEIDQEEAA